MDLVYIPEVLTYGSFRSTQYRDYEQPWNKDHFSYGKSPQFHYQRWPQQHHQQKQKHVSKENCYLCRESKRRSLAAYIRGKSRRNSCQEIHEEEEEHEATNNENDSATINNETSEATIQVQKIGDETTEDCYDKGTK